MIWWQLLHNAVSKVFVFPPCHAHKHAHYLERRYGG
jgi:hypothetical protein